VPKIAPGIVRRPDVRKLTRDDEDPALIKSPGYRQRREPGYGTGLGVAAICTKMNAAAAGRIRREYTSPMRLRPLLLHALLSLALVANGIGGAMAAVHAVCAHAAVAAASPAAEPPCHEGMGTDTSNAHHGIQHESTSQHRSASDQESCGDCARHCQCDCIAHGLAALVPSTILLPASAGIAYTPMPSYAHAAPVLPHPVRPPIG
jgi:hypothetical protein